MVTLRPQMATRFSTNYFHDTWHILAGTGGAVLLGRTPRRGAQDLA